jgi:hypothetical protein
VGAQSQKKYFLKLKGRDEWITGKSILNGGENTH